MVGSPVRVPAAVGFCLMTGACAGAPGRCDRLSYGHAPAGAPETHGTRIETPEGPLQCVTFARARTGIDIHGDASVWWEKAAGHYAREDAPLLGSILVLTGYAGP